MSLTLGSSDQSGAAAPDWSRAIIEGLSGPGFAVLPGFLTAELCDLLHAEAIALGSEPESGVARVGRDHDRVNDGEIRRGCIHWLDGHTKPQQDFLRIADELRLFLNRNLLLGLFEFEAQLALYRPGDFYARHVDSFAGARNRVVSLVVYFNRSWIQVQGGALLIWPPDPARSLALAPLVVSVPNPPSPQAPIVVYPDAGTLVLMLSEDIAHEVCPSTRPRTSIAGWWRVNQSLAGRSDPPTH